MSNQTLNLTEKLYQYLINQSLRESALQRELREETAKLPMARMQIAPEQGQFMALLVKLMGARRAIEVGVFTGYSALSVAQALPDNGQLIACDVSESYTAIAKKFWERAGVLEKVDLRLAPALETLQSLVNEGDEGQFDFAFIDADKESYCDYYEYCLRLLRVGGLMLIDNVLWGGTVIDPADNDKDTRAIRAFNAALLDDDRVDISLLPIADGLTLALKR